MDILKISSHLIPSVVFLEGVKTGVDEKKEIHDKNNCNMSLMGRGGLIRLRNGIPEE